MTDVELTAAVDEVGAGLGFWTHAASYDRDEVAPGRLLTRAQARTREVLVRRGCPVTPRTDVLLVLEHLLALVFARGGRTVTVSLTHADRLLQVRVACSVDATGCRDGAGDQATAALDVLAEDWGSSAGAHGSRYAWATVSLAIGLD